MVHGRRITKGIEAGAALPVQAHFRGPQRKKHITKLRQGGKGKDAFYVTLGDGDDCRKERRKCADKLDYGQTSPPPR